MNQPRHQNWITIAEPADPNAEGFNNTAISSAWKGQRGSPVPQTAEGRAYNGLQAAPLKPDDIVLAMTTSKAHEHLALETRLSRKVRASCSRFARQDGSGLTTLYQQSNLTVTCQSMLFELYRSARHARLHPSALAFHWQPLVKCWSADRFSLTSVAVPEKLA